MDRKICYRNGFLDTNFVLGPGDLQRVSNAEGVSTIHTGPGRYRYAITVGSLFNAESVIAEVARVLNARVGECRG